ncbi:hypothetical protein EV182_003935 [Spiromyces aspiralis]|uniref:Uncharacterized protein n=1 Tax=Spiromyces aspiralis TaxID=68401 RepID=A0ACC1HC26_9FUNG|nr:hypothetical protein EV182_003935 [Spiromyces aspiralis]
MSAAYVQEVWNRFPINYARHQFEGLSSAVAATGTVASSSANPKYVFIDAPLKRLMIKVRAIDSIRELDDFIHNSSLQHYQELFTLAIPDLVFIEAVIERDLGYQSYLPATQQQQQQQYPTRTAGPASNTSSGSRAASLGGTSSTKTVSSESAT